MANIPPTYDQLRLLQPVQGEGAGADDTNSFAEFKTTTEAALRAFTLASSHAPDEWYVVGFCYSYFL